MFGYRKHSFARAHALLQILRANLNDLKTLKELQKLLLSEIIRAEKNIKNLKAELKAIKKTDTGADAKRSAYLERRIDGFRKGAYIWRCFGDAIAFLYMDKFALKHSFYKTENTNAKQDAGFIVVNQGLANELALLDSALEHNVPAVLVDLTNTIRHGDVCLMGESDPFLIEVKSSKKLNNRAKKQKRSLEKLHTFYETDKCEGLRGYSELRRQVNRMPERVYVSEINECITDALKNGYAVRRPEFGLYYIVMKTNGVRPGQVMGSLDLKAPWIFFLNQAKMERTWMPYLPFTLTIKDKDHLWNFIQGNIYILVLMESDALCQIAINKGHQARFDLDDEQLYPLRIELSENGGMVGISGHMLTRIGMEFVSPEWVVLSSIEAFKTHTVKYTAIASLA